MARDVDEAARIARAHSVLVRLLLPPYTIHFKSSAYVRTDTLELLDKKCKDELKITAQDAAARYAIGSEAKFWAELLLLLRAAVPSLERRCFSIWDPSSVDYESTSGSLIAGHHPGLWWDLERINDLISITRNVLTIGAVAQDLAAQHQIDHEVFRLINCCVRVTARGYDGDAGTGEEEKWQWIVNAYKKLLNTCLMFLNNLVAQNEKRKLMLWVTLFDSATDSCGSTDDADAARQKQIVIKEKVEREIAKPAAAKPSPPITANDILLAYGTNGSSRISPIEYEGAIPVFKDHHRPLPPQILNMIKKNHFEPNGYVYFTHVSHARALEHYQRDHKRSPSLAEIHRAMPAFWESDRNMDGRSEKKMWDHWQGRYAQALTNYRREMEAYEKGDYVAPLTPKQIEQKEAPKPFVESAAPKSLEPEKLEEKIRVLEEQLREKYMAELKAAAEIGDGEACRTINEALLSLSREGESDDAGLATVQTDDMQMSVTAATGIKVLENGKTELMKKLEGYAREDYQSQPTPASRDLVAAGDPQRRRRSVQSLSDAFVPESLGSEEEDEEDESDEEDDDEYPGSSEDGRGLLTDVPLILGPSEIEVLPMLVMSGIVQAPPGSNAAKAQLANSGPQSQDTYTLRTHVLLSQTSGRNLLRELLIFVAAWDLREAELYFKFMIQIMESILKSGLMPYAYHALRDRSRSKDIISPAQAVIIKMLTCIFRGRNEGSLQNVSSAIIRTGENAAAEISRAPSKVDLHVLNFIFTEFRQHIIPQTCALIFLQGQIHRGRASPEDFPLNLWDMERMYEGVYQFLEFFAVLAEEQVAGRSGDAASTKITTSDSDGERFSWKKILAEWEMASELVTLLRELESGIPKTVEPPPLVQQNARRGFMEPPPPPQRSLSADAATMPSVSIDRPFDMDDSALQTSSLSQSSQVFDNESTLAYPDDSLNQQSMHDQDEPSDFEWRNLKKLTVLVLSSLIWKNKQVQDQFRRCGGLNALVACCKDDEHNPYIREHAIMCLRFAVEGNEENAEVIRQMGIREQNSIPTPSSSRYNGAPLLESISSVPKEVLDTNGYETFMDEKGQVGLRRKSTMPPPSTTNASSAQNTAGAAIGSAGSSSSSSNSTNQPPKFSATKMTAEKAAELMQNALRDLPLGDKLVTNRQKAQVLARLDRAFESTEKALEGKRG